MCKHVPPLRSRGPVEVAGHGSTEATGVVEVTSGVAQAAETDAAGVESDNTVPPAVMALVAATSRCSRMMVRTTFTRSSSERSPVAVQTHQTGQTLEAEGVVVTPAPELTALFVPGYPCRRMPSVPMAGLSVE